MLKMVNFMRCIFNHNFFKNLFRIHIFKKVKEESMSTVKERHGRHIQDSNQTSRDEKYNV